MQILVFNLQSQIVLRFYILFTFYPVWKTLHIFNNFPISLKIIVDGPINQCEIFTQNDGTMPKAVKLYYGTMHHGHLYFHLIGGQIKSLFDFDWAN